MRNRNQNVTFGFDSSNLSKQVYKKEVQDLNITNFLTVSGSLVLSGASIFSGSINVDPNINFSSNNTSYHVRAVNSHLILSSSVGSIVSVSSSLDFPNTDKNYHLRSVNSHLILSSSIGSVIASSASLDFPNADKSYHIRSVNSHLILSSSVGSISYVSGNMIVSNALTCSALSFHGATAFRATRTTGVQMFTSSVYTPWFGTSESYDDDGNATAANFTVNNAAAQPSAVFTTSRAGYYWFGGNAYLTSVGVNARTAGAIFVNGVRIAESPLLTAPVGGTTSAYVTTALKLSAGDAVSFRIWHDSPGFISGTTGEPEINWFAGFQIR